MTYSTGFAKISAEKKMSERSKVITYYPAEIHKGKDYYVGYYVLNPGTGKLTIKKTRLNRLKGAVRDKYARDLVRQINDKLARGWNPYIEQAAPKSMNRLIDVIEIYRNFMERELEENSLRSYNSFLNFFKSYIEKELNRKEMYVFQFSKEEASEMMLYLMNDKTKTARTYNNYLLFFRTFFYWLIQYNYSTINPFTTIKKLKQKEKKREPVPKDIQDRLRDYLQQNNPHFLATMLLCYYCFIRPKEICLLKIADIDLTKGFVRVDADIAKNDHTSFRTMPSDLIEILRPIVKDQPQNYYLVSQWSGNKYDFKPGSEPIDSRKIGKYWEKLRKELDIPKNITFYSLKDTGIIQMSRDGVSWKDIQDQADHSSGDITRIYARYREPGGSQQIRERASTFGKNDQEER
jgi:integrase